LSFEYAWQFPHASRFTYRVVEAERIPKRSPRSRPVTLQLRVLKAMLSVEKWAGVPMMINIHERGIIDYVPEADALRAMGCRPSEDRAEGAASTKDETKVSTHVQPAMSIVSGRGETTHNNKNAIRPTAHRRWTGHVLGLARGTPT